jgi:Family of unknown function (DUF6267)
MKLIKFSSFLVEETTDETKGKALKHLTHVEDNVIHGGHEGIGLADSHLREVHNKLLGKNSKVHVSTKWDGAPSIVFGTHPQTGKFFVASKSAFNKTPKINYTPEDIEKNHGHAPGLVEKLKAGLEHLPKIMPHEGGVFQGDLLHTKGDATTKNGMTSVTPNTITYSAPKGSPEAEKMKRNLGIVVHTQYKGRGNLESMTAGPLDDKTRSKFREHHDVNNVDPSMEPNPQNYTPDEQNAFLHHMEKARQIYSKMKPEALEALKGHGQNLEAHVNDMVRKDGKPSVEGYKEYLTNKHKKELDKLKSPQARNSKIQKHGELMQDINDNHEHFKKALELHNEFQKAKNVLVGVMAKNNPYQHTVNGQATDPEGAVVVDKKGNMSKFVNRAEFSRQNFLKGQFSKQKEAENENA